MVVAIVLVAALLAVPRAAKPGVFPVPLIDSTEEAAERAKLAALAERAEREGLPFETRAVGDAVRRFGLALSGSGGDHAARLLIERVQAAVSARQMDALVRLRAYQARAFVAAVRAQDFRRAPSAELRALGGDFLERAKRSGWSGPQGFVGSDDELCTLFLLRWAELTQLQAKPELRPTLGELRRYYRFLILHPEQDPSEQDVARGHAKARLRYVTALARRDSQYPLGLARGSLLGELGMWPESAQSLDGYLGRPSGAAWNLRARNYLLFAAKHGGETAEPQPF